MGVAELVLQDGLTVSKILDFICQSAERINQGLCEALLIHILRHWSLLSDQLVEKKVFYFSLLLY